MDSKKNLVIDIVAVVVYAVVANPVVTGIAFHEWVSIGLLLVFVVHVAAHFDWIIETMRTVFRAPSFNRVGNLVLDVGLAVVFMVCNVSGMLVSGVVLQAFGYYAQGYYFWDPLHAISAKILLALLLVHLVVHWKWLAGVFTKRRGTK